MGATMHAGPDRREFVICPEPTAAEKAAHRLIDANRAVCDVILYCAEARANGEDVSDIERRLDDLRGRA